MKSSLNHLQVNVKPDNLPFYADLTKFLGWSTIYEGDGMLGVGAETGPSLWFTSATKGSGNDYDGPGVNHIGIGVATQADVDEAAQYLAELTVEPLFGTPCHRPEFAASEKDTYYQVMFESPDRVLFEVVYTGPKG